MKYVLEEVQRTVMKRICQRQLAFLEHVLRRQGLENLVMTGRIKGRRARGRQRLKYLDSLCAPRKDNVSPIATRTADQGFGRQECSGIGRSPTSSTTSRHHSNNDSFLITSLRFQIHFIIIGLCRLSNEATRIPVAHRLGCRACEPHIILCVR